jgi:hypothetical protein
MRGRQVGDEQKDFDIVCKKKDGEMELSVFEIKERETWVVMYRFFHDSITNFYALKDGIGFIGGKGGLFKVSFSVTAPTMSKNEFVESNVFVNLIDEGENKEIMKIGNVTVGKALIVGEGFQKIEKLLVSVQLSEKAKTGEYEGMMTISLD